MSVDPLLGHWRADTKRLVRYGTAGQISHNTTVAHRQEFDFAATIYIQLDYARNGAPFCRARVAVPAREAGSYDRTGEEIGFSVGPTGPD